MGVHGCLWIDIPEIRIFGSTMPVPMAPKACRLKTEDPQIVKKYVEYLEQHITRHDLLEKMKTIANQLNKASNLTDKIRIQFDTIDNLWIQGMLRAEHQCCKLNTQPYGWTPSITYLIQVIKYW